MILKKTIFLKECGTSKTTIIIVYLSHNYINLLIFRTKIIRYALLSFMLWFLLHFILFLFKIYLIRMADILAYLFCYITIINTVSSLLNFSTLHWIDGVYYFYNLIEILSIIIAIKEIRIIALMTAQARVLHKITLK